MIQPQEAHTKRTYIHDEIILKMSTFLKILKLKLKLNSPHYPKNHLKFYAILN